ncbi:MULTISPECIES: lipase family protein [unclassified Nocardia]|uniref:lipase family protein n=1 Tax=unclassified Nocardia TaxID=2637762 RepID=UPI00278C7428|nr:MULTISPECIES: lipase family protein [unclassified Nocardia]
MAGINGDRRRRGWRRFTAAALATAAVMSTAVAMSTAALLGTAGTAAAAPQPVDVDPFYQAPEGFESAAPGDILRSREVQLAVLTVLPVRVRAWQLLYRTTDLFEQPTVAATTVAVPVGADTARSRPLVSHQFFYDSAAPHCAPSFLLQQGGGLAGVEGIHSNVEYLELAASISQGYAINVPDYEGLNGHLAVAKEPGYMVLDSIRAAERFEPLGLDGANTPVALWGYSGGGMASGWAAEMHPTYAPELNIKGAAIGAPVSDVESLLHVNGSMFSSLIGIGIASLMNAYPEFAAATERVLTPEGRAMMNRTNAQCLPRNALTMMFVDYQKMLTIPIAEYLALPEVREVFDATVLGKHAPTMPIMLYQGVFDEAVPVFDNDALVPKWCAGGTSVLYKRDHLSEHLTLPTLGMGDAFNWVRGRLAPGAPDPVGCQTENHLSLFFDLQDILMQTEINLNATFGALGWPIGPQER